MKSRIITIFLSFLIFTQVTSLYAQSLIKGVTTVLVIDVSGSMTANDPNRRALDSAQLFVDLLSAGDEIGLVFFSGGISAKAGMFSITNDHETSKKQIKEIINSQKYEGGTEIIGALRVGLSLLKSSKFLNQEDRDLSLILLTDGVDGNSDSTYARMRIEALQMGVELHPIAFGESAIASSRRLKMLSIKELLVVNHPEDLPSTFATIFGRIHDVLIKNFQTKAGGLEFKVHPLAIETNMIL